MIQNTFNEEFIKNDKSHVQKKTKLTIMCMVYKEDGSFLVENRVKKDWPGLTFPGGHVEDDEYITDAVVREMKEETGLTVSYLEPRGYIEWNNFGDDVRHLAMLFKTKSFKGQVKSSKEGEIFFIKEADIEKYPLSNDFLKIYELLK
ncbi:MAG: NUDIX domain-containing protein [Bacilli bacterium]|nr:NUDIX domain-containing protein [Bacilli bacterium]